MCIMQKVGKVKCYMCGEEREERKMYPKGIYRICFSCKENEDLIQWEMKREMESADRYNYEKEPKWRRNDHTWR